MKTGIYLTIVLAYMVTACNVQSGNQQEQTEKPQRPNIVLLFTDDQTYESIGALGNDEIHTPNIDRLVNAGTTFTHANNMDGMERCVASRSMMISGQYI